MLIGRRLFDQPYTSTGRLPLGDLDEAWRCAQVGGWEGIVYKRTGSVWRTGERSSDWRKRKVWTRSTLYVSAFREGGGEIDRVAIVDADMQPKGTLEIYSTFAGDHLRDKVGKAASAPNRSGWRSVPPSVSVSVQYRLSPSGRLREPFVLAMY